MSRVVPKRKNCNKEEEKEDKPPASEASFFFNELQKRDNNIDC